MPHSRCNLRSLFPEQIPPSGATKARYPIMDINVPCHLVSPRQLPPGVSLETHIFVSRESLPQAFIWQTSEAKEPQNRWWEFRKDVPAPWSRAEVPTLPLNEITGVQQQFFYHRMELSAGCTGSWKLDTYSSISPTLMSTLLLLDCYQHPGWQLKKPHLGGSESHQRACTNTKSR